MKNDKVFYKNTIMLYLMTAATYLFPIIVLPYLTRVLRPEYYGIATFMTATISYFKIFVDFGFNFSSTKKISQNKNNIKYIGTVVGFTIQGKMILVAISFIVFSIMTLFIDILRDNVVLGFLYFLSMAITIFLTDFLYRGIEKMEIITLRYVVAKTISTVFTFIVVRSSDDLILVPILSIIGTLTAVVLTWIHIKKKLKIKIYYSHIKEVFLNLKDSSVYFIATFATTAFAATNTFVLGIINYPTEQIACWTLAYQLLSAALACFGPIIQSLYPHMTSKLDLKFVKKIIYLSLPVLIVVSIVGILLSNFLILIFGGQGYEDAVVPLQILIVLLPFSYLSQVIGFPVLGAMGFEKQVTITTVIAALFHIFGIIILVIFNWMGLVSLAILRLFTEVLLCMQRIVLLNKAFVKSK